MDILLIPFVFAGGVILYLVRKAKVQRMRCSRAILRTIGVFPIIDHYYEPLFNPRRLRYSLRKDRVLPGIDLNTAEQLNILSKLTFSGELSGIPSEKTGVDTKFAYKNVFFEYADADYYYNIIRLFKPRKIIEVGSGNSTLIALRAVEANKKNDPNYSCELTYIEPYESPYLEKLGVNLMRERVEDIDRSIFDGLGPNDILFIDSSHVIRPQGDVLFEYLEVLPVLKKGVLVHIHDILTPKDYLDRWIKDEVKLYNEQYLAEAFLTFNREYRIIGALNYLRHNHFDELSKKCPSLLKDPDPEPLSLWIIRN